MTKTTDLLSQAYETLSWAWEHRLQERGADAEARKLVAEAIEHLGRAIDRLS